MLKKKQIIVAFAAVFMVFVLAPASQARSLSRSEASLLQAVNTARSTYGLQPLAFDLSLERAARAHSREMLVNRYFGHGAFGSRLRVFGVRGLVGENLAWGRGLGAQGIVQMWLASPKHRANLLRPNFRRIGIGALAGSFQGYGGATVVTADFAG